MPLLRSGLVLAFGNGIGSPGLTRAASRDLQNVRAFGYCVATYKSTYFYLLLHCE